MSKVSDRVKRVEMVNKIIEKIASCGRQFFLKRKGICRFELFNGKPRYIDTYNNVQVYPYGAKTYKFSNGGTLWELVKEFREFIMTGKPVEYSGLYVDYWGYPSEDMQDIQKFAKEIGYLKTLEVAK
jgi:hypothetical protein